MASLPGVATLSRRMGTLTPPAPPPTAPPVSATGTPVGLPLFTAPPPVLFGQGAPGLGATRAPAVPNIQALMTPPPFPGAPPATPAVGNPGQMTGQGSGPFSGGGALGSLGGEYAVLDQYNKDFQAAAAKYGLPVNTLKAIAAVERGWEGTSPSGAVGIMQVMPQYWGDLGYDLYSPSGNIMAGAAAYKSFYDQYKDEAIRRGMDPYVAAARAYLAGNPWSTQSDYYGTTTDVYGDRFSNFLDQLGGSAGAPTGGGTTTGGGSWQNAWNTMFHTSTAGDYGWNAPNDLGYYAYGTQYGMDGTGHTGIDQPMPVGTPYYAPLGGVVTCAGTGRGSGADGGGCGAFNDYFGQGAGRVEVLLDNGVLLIFGHSSTSALQPGQRFDAGALLGTSGGQNGPHVHLEARVRDASTPSGWRIVDPRTVLGGMGGAPTGQGGGTLPGGGGRGAGGLLTLRDILGW